MADAELCRKIQCGALSQDDAGMAAVYECSQAGMVGVLSCNHPDCAPYLDEMRYKGVCADPNAGRVVEVLPLHPALQPDQGQTPMAPVPINLPKWETPGVKTVNPPVADPGWGQGRGTWCQAMAWVDANPCLSVALVIAGWWVLKGGR